jgi:KUP system potassium uptake protein
MASKAADAPAEEATPSGEQTQAHGHGGKLTPRAFLGLALGSMGVVFGDIGTSPLYAMKEALHHSRPGLGLEESVLGVVSLVLWSLTLIVTIKYVIFLMRADNKGEGGTLVLMSLAQRAMGKSLPLFLGLGIVGAALFYGDGIITPAISVLSAVEGITDAPGAPASLSHYVAPAAAVILVGLFMAQSKGTQRVATFFGPIMCLWFLAIGGIGLMHLVQDWTVLRAINPWHGAKFLAENGLTGFFVLGSVVLAVTGAEALYADMGHFGKWPIRASWLAFAFPALALCYLGQAATVLHNPAARENPFWQAIPQVIYWPMLILANTATVIASQAVISGAYSLTQQAVQLGLLPRIDIRRTSETQAGQIFVPAINNFLMIGVLVLLFVFQSSSRLAAAYGIAVTGAMFVDTLLAIVVVHRLWKWNWLQTSALIVPVAIVDLIFISSNLLKIPDGAWLPLVLGAALVIVMWTWTRGAQILTDKTRRESVPLTELSDILRARAPHRAPGTAIFLTSTPDQAPVALLHNLKHNKVLHERNVVLTVRTATTPRVEEEDRVDIEQVNADFQKVTVNYGFMESPNLPKALQVCRKKGLKFDIMATSFFLGRRSVVPSANSGMPLWQDRLFIFLMKNAANPTDFFKIPPGRVVELGAQVTV